MNSLDLLLLLLSVLLWLNQHQRIGLKNYEDNGYEPNRIPPLTCSQQDEKFFLMKTAKLPSIAKDVPKLSHETARLWKFQLMVNTRRFDITLGAYLFDDPTK